MFSVPAVPHCNNRSAYSMCHVNQYDAVYRRHDGREKVNQSVRNLAILCGID